MLGRRRARHGLLLLPSPQRDSASRAYGADVMAAPPTAVKATDRAAGAPAPNRTFFAACDGV